MCGSYLRQVQSGNDRWLSVSGSSFLRTELSWVECQLDYWELEPTTESRLELRKAWVAQARDYRKRSASHHSTLSNKNPSWQCKGVRYIILTDNQKLRALWYSLCPLPRSPFFIRSKTSQKYNTRLQNQLPYVIQNGFKSSYWAEQLFDRETQLAVLKAWKLLLLLLFLFLHLCKSYSCMSQIHTRVWKDSCNNMKRFI